MLRTLHLFYVLHVAINTGVVSALDEGRFLWAQKNVKNFTNNGKGIITPGKWTRSVFNWLHSPLINSIQEAFVVDSAYENLSPATKCFKRSASKKDLNIEESFENEFFLWEDNEGNPLEFGIKQIQDVSPHHRLNQSHLYHSNSFWEEPLFYEDNEDVKEIDINHLSYHERMKLNDILKNKMNSVIKHIVPNKHTTKVLSKYYTIDSPVTKNALAAKDKFSKYYLGNQFKGSRMGIDKVYKKKNEEMKQANNSKKYEENGGSVQNSIKTRAHHSAIMNISKDPLYKNNGNTTKCQEGKVTRKEINPVFNRNLKSLGSKNSDLKNLPYSLESLLYFNNANYNEEESENPVSSALNNHQDKKKNNALNSEKVQNIYVIDEAKNRNLRTIYNQRFLKHRRKGKRKHFKFKYPEGRSYQYELFDAEIRPSQQ